jgi:hypothetical protein
MRALQGATRSSLRALTVRLITFRAKYHLRNNSAPRLGLAMASLHEAAWRDDVEAAQAALARGVHPDERYKALLATSYSRAGLCVGASGLTCELFQPQGAYQRTLASVSTPSCFVLLLVYSRAGCCVCALGLQAFQLLAPSSRFPTLSYLASLSFPPSCSLTSAFACSLTRLLAGGLLRARDLFNEHL